MPPRRQMQPRGNPVITTHWICSQVTVPPPRKQTLEGQIQTRLMEDVQNQGVQSVVTIAAAGAIQKVGAPDVAPTGDPSSTYQLGQSKTSLR